jgi:DNA polymerase III subunit epsilon
MDSPLSLTNPEDLIRELEKSGDYRVFRKLKKSSAIHLDDHAPKKIGIVLDVETTGLEYEKEKIIELGMIVFEFSSDGRIFKILEEFDQFEDPGKPIPPEITTLTGITDKDVKGKKISDAKVNELVEQAVLIIAHNAAFDRPFVERRFPIFSTKYWGCSQTQIPWKTEGIGSSKLEFIATCYRFFYDAHRAIDDCWAVLKVLTSDLPASGSLVLNTLLSKARESSYLIDAIGAGFDKKDFLKDHHYKWNPDKKVWSKEVMEKNLEIEETFLRTSIYPTQNPSYATRKITGLTRFSKRIS